MDVLFIGYGRMGGALGDAWLKSALVNNLTVVDPGLPADPRAGVFSQLADVPREQAFQLIVLAVKPAYASSALAGLSDRQCNQATVISVAAGITEHTLSEAVGRRCPVVRAMPNTPVLVGAGCTGLYAHGQLDAARKAAISQLFEAVGAAYWVEEEAMLDAVTAISGSGPAYYHLFSEALAQAGVKLGLNAELAKNLAAQTAFGAASLQHQPHADFTELRVAVTSPNGTTAAAIEVFEQQGKLRELVGEATGAAYRRSVELSQG
ncbi:pyrroline-5-carboxylate reductase [Pseudomonas sp. PSKL.D1]|uniref:pyrroline-5-carboxylate reductase n=1 Tax=Pseudomonas sp. PSKL.D1 TaxID=3029060 RepID=UPI002380D4C6|nr:pyrroline-5-carboxylate reductase [Pseudomonas sp. PSKL.D1]WDY59567.1 pyrroline-5-carboxylate reductase [Pseudomonas sp. PSKL.D1]